MAVDPARPSYEQSRTTHLVAKMGTKETPDFGPYVESWRERLARRESEQEAWAQHLREVAHACARRLVRDFGARRVYLFGSLLEQDVVHRRSDIDLAVEGLEGELYFKAWGELGSLLPPGVELDLIPLEQARPGPAARVRTERVLLGVAA